MREHRRCLACVLACMAMVVSAGARAQSSASAEQEARAGRWVFSLTITGGSTYGIPIALNYFPAVMDFGACQRLMRRETARVAEMTLQADSRLALGTRALGHPERQSEDMTQYVVSGGTRAVTGVCLLVD